MNTVLIVDNYYQVYRGKIDSTGTVIIKGESFRFLEVSIPSRGKLTALEKIGYIRLDANSPNQFDSYQYQNFFNSDLTPMIVSLLCYNDMNTNLQFVASADSCNGKFLVSRLNRIPKDDIKVYTQGQDVVINSNTPLQKVEVYDLTGRLLQTQPLHNRKAATLHGVATAQTLLIVHLTTSDHHLYSKKVWIP